MIDPILTATLTRIADLLADAQRPWWIIGSAAVALHGVTVAVARDVDVLVDAKDLPLLAVTTGAVARPGVSDGKFRSGQVLRLTDAPLAVEMFADLRVRDGDDWRLLRLATREPIRVGAATLFVPAAAELIDVLQLFGRDKDLARADLLRGTFGQASPKSFGPNAAGSSSLSR